MTSTQAAAKPNKPTVNLMTTTPQGPPVETAQIGTSEPPDTSVIPYTDIHSAKWGPWLFQRLVEFWPHLTAMNYRGFLFRFGSGNSSQLLRSANAIILAVLTVEALETRPVVDIVFCFKHHPDSQEEDKDVRRLLRRVEDWARGHGATAVRVSHQNRCDISYARMKDALGGSDGRVLLKEIAK